MTDNPATKYFATGVAAVVLTFGAYLIGKSNTDPATAGTNASSPAVQGAAPPTGQAPRNGQVPPGFGAQVSAATLTKLKAVVSAKYPGTIERAMKLGNGSYVVHVLGSSSETHVLVSKDFKITGTETGGPGGGGAPPSGTQPQAAASASGSPS
jgi:hypothetical protein